MSDGRFDVADWSSNTTNSLPDASTALLAASTNEPPCEAPGYRASSPVKLRKTRKGRAAP